MGTEVFWGWEKSYLFDLSLDGEDRFIGVGKDFKDGVVEGLDFDIDEFGVFLRFHFETGKCLLKHSIIICHFIHSILNKKAKAKSILS